VPIGEQYGHIRARRAAVAEARIAAGDRGAQYGHLRARRAIQDADPVVSGGGGWDRHFRALAARALEAKRRRDDELEAAEDAEIAEKQSRRLKKFQRRLVNAQSLYNESKELSTIRAEAAKLELTIRLEQLAQAQTAKLLDVAESQRRIQAENQLRLIIAWADQTIEEIDVSWLMLVMASSA
jgi:hypothetical protein